MISFMTAGISCTGKKVPLKKAMGMIKKLEYVAVSSWDLASIPVITPKLAKRKQVSRRVTAKRAEREKRDEVRRPTTIMRAEAKSPLTMPARTSPTMMDEEW